MRARPACPADWGLSLSGQDQGVGGPLRGAPRLIRSVADLPLVEHLEGVVVERPRIGEEEVYPVSGHHVSTPIAHQPRRLQCGLAARTARGHALGVQDQIRMPQSKRLPARGPRTDMCSKLEGGQPWRPPISRPWTGALPVNRDHALCLGGIPSGWKEASYLATRTAPSSSASPDSAHQGHESYWLWQTLQRTSPPLWCNTSETPNG